MNVPTLQPPSGSQGFGGLFTALIVCAVVSAIVLFQQGFFKEGESPGLNLPAEPEPEPVKPRVINTDGAVKTYYPVGDFEKGVMSPK